MDRPPYSFDISPELDKILGKLAKKNRFQYEQILNKIEEVIKNPQHYKNLRVPLQHWKRVHIDSHFVLTFSVDEEHKKVTFKDFQHHDSMYN